jgi:hypothetical protein
MKTRGVLAIILITCWFGVVPAAAHDCCHHDQHYADGNDCNHDCDHGAQGGRHCGAWTPSGGAPDLRTAEGKITEVVYLPGATPDSGMVEVHLQSAGQSLLVRLAPVGFLKQSGLLLREGDTVTVKGFPVAGMEGDLLVATELHKGEKTLSLRDPRGRPAW